MATLDLRTRGVDPKNHAHSHRNKIAAAFAGDHAGVKPGDVEILEVIPAESNKGNGKGQKPTGGHRLLQAGVRAHETTAGAANEPDVKLDRSSF